MCKDMQLLIVAWVTDVGNVMNKEGIIEEEFG